MGAKEKIKNVKYASESGYLLEKISSGVVNFFKNILIQSYRFRRKTVQKGIFKVINEFYGNEGKVSALLKNIIGEFSRFDQTIHANEKDKILTLADDYLNHRFSLLGFGQTGLDQIDWHTDFKSGFRWDPGKFYRDYVQIDLANDADIKIPRELSRSHHFLILGEAYLLTGDEKYTQEFLDQINNWIEENPFMHSINWACTMDVAIRAVNWIWALALFQHSPLLTRESVERIMISLYEHGYFIYRNPEKSLENNHNHYISDLVGQVYLGLLFRDLSEPKKWLNKGILELFKEMRWQILPSGPSYERATNYHRLVLELFASAIILLAKNSIEVPFDIWYRLEKMFEFVMYYTKPDGTAPIIGDQDDGRLHPFGFQKNIDHRYLLSVGSILFKRPDFKKYSEGCNLDCFFLFGKEAEKKYDEIENTDIKLFSKAFPDAGFYIMRKDEYYMFINISGKGTYSERSKGTHTHSDLLSFELFVGDRAFIIDPGSYIYSANPKERKLFRSTKMHNTVLVDGFDQNIIKEDVLWDFERNAIPKLYSWITNDEYDFFDGEHTGYLRLDAQVTHRRAIHFDKKNIKWEITDYLTGEGEHLFEWYFHFDIGIDFDINSNGVITNRPEGTNISLNFDSKEQFQIEKESGWVSTGYGRREEAIVLRIFFKARCPTQLRTIIEKK